MQVNFMRYIQSCRVLSLINESITSSASASKCSSIMPAPDKVYRERKKEEAATSRAVIDVVEMLKELVAKQAAKLTPPSTSTGHLNNLSPCVEGALMILRGSLDRIHPSLHLDCVSAVIAVLKTFGVQKQIKIGFTQQCSPSFS